MTRVMTPESHRPVFWAGLRTPFMMAHRGGLKACRPDDLLIALLREHQIRYGSAYSSVLTDHLLGCAYPEGEQGYNLARTTALGAGLSVSGTTVNRLCGSSLEALSNASAQVMAGRGDFYLVSGVESMSRVPRRGANFSESAVIREIAPEAYINMGETAERVATKYSHITRSIQEEFAARSHEMANKAWSAGLYTNTVFAVDGVSRDEAIRYPTSLEKMASLTPAFLQSGVVTAATSSPMSDGATCGFISSAQFARNQGIKHGLEILDVQTAHVAPELMGLGPVPAVQRILKRHDLKISAISAVEMNEAFAIQALACRDDLGLNPSIVNSWGGALALGHPLGASGLRLVMTLHERLIKEGAENGLGLATLCVGGGQGVAVLARLVEL